MKSFTKIIKSPFVTIYKFFKNHPAWTTIIVLAILGGLYLYLRPATNNSKVEEIVVVRKNLEEAVSLTGRVKPVSDASVTFEKSGTVRNVNVKTGDRVSRGQTLATLSADDVYARVSEAQASVDAQLATLAELGSGPKDEQINLKQVSIDNAKNNIDVAYDSIKDSIRSISIGAGDIVRNNFYTYFDGNATIGYSLNTQSCQSGLESDVNRSRARAEAAAINVDTISNNYPNLTTEAEKRAEIANLKTNLTEISSFLNDMRALFSSDCMLTNKSYDSVRSTIASSRSAISGYQTDLNNKLNNISTLNISLKQAEEDLRLLQAGEKTDKIRQQEAQVKAARARLAQASADASKNVLRAPFNGLVTAVDLKTGEYATMGGGKSISLISDSNFEIESKVSEVDVAKIKVGDKAVVTFDAYGDGEKFEASITNISPAGVITDGVPTYKTIFSFVSKDERIKSGLTSNIDVVTKVHENVLVLPARAVKNDKGVRKVTVKGEKENTEKEVTVGARGTSGEVEIVSGIAENDVLVIDTTK
jgi:multidrug resistance efflux pump